jgi:DnaJ family protein C protein 9
MDDQDPMSQIFPDQESVDLYEVLNLTNTATSYEIKKAYRQLALIHHPDKHATADDGAKATASLKFQQIGFAYAVLSDEKRKERYDKTGSTTEGFDFGPGDGGWETYFEDLFERVTRGRLDELKREYQGSSSSHLLARNMLIYGTGSAEETEDLKKAYLDTKGSIGEIMTHISHSTIDDEPRFIVAITKLIKDGKLPKMQAWQKAIKDEKARLLRRKEGQKEAAEAEALAKELGVWDEFYGDGNPTKGEGKGKARAKGEGDEPATLQAVILRRKEQTAKTMTSFFNTLEAKYAGGEKIGKGKKRGHAEVGGDDGPSTKKFRAQDIPEDEWRVIQERLFGDGPKITPLPPLENKPTKKKKGRKASAK